jgi:hypothetical protein
VVGHGRLRQAKRVDQVTHAHRAVARGSMFTIRTRAGSANALNTAAVAIAWSSDSAAAANGPQHPTGSATLRLTANSSYRPQSIYRRASIRASRGHNPPVCVGGQATGCDASVNSRKAAVTR